MFKRSYKISLHRVHDTVAVKEGGETLKLHVESDPMRMVAGLTQAQKLMQNLNDNSTEDEVNGAAQYFATVIFGKEQAEKLLAFYHNDAGCVISLCGKYFEGRLSKLITQAQKKSK